MADGSVVIEVDLDISDGEKKLAKLNEKIDQLENNLQKQEAKKSYLETQIERVNEKAIEAGNTIRLLQKEIEAFEKNPGGSKSETQTNLPYKDIDSAKTALRGFEQEYEELLGNMSKLDNQINHAQIQLESMKDEVGALNRALALARVSISAAKMEQAEEKVTSAAANVVTATAGINENMSKAGLAAGQFVKRIASLARTSLIFSTLMPLLNTLTQWFGTVATSTAETSGAIAKLKGAFLTLAQPLLNILIPTLTFLINVLTRIVSVVASVISLFSGGIGKTKNQAEALSEQTSGFGAAGSAAKNAAEDVEEYKDATAGIDELNIISAPEAADVSTGGGGGAASSIAPDFDFETDGALSLLGILKAMVPLVGILGLLFGEMGLGIGLVVSGITLLVAGFADAFENGWTLENSLSAIMGLVLGGLGISVLTETWIPALIAAIAAIILSLVQLTGNGQQMLDGLRLMFQGVVDFLAGAFTGDLDLAFQGISNILAGFKLFVESIINGIRDAFIFLLDKLDELTGGKLSSIINFIKNLLINLIESAKEIFGGLLLFLEGVFTLDMDKIWRGLVNIIIGALNLGIGAVEAGLQFIVDLLWIFLDGVFRVANKLGGLVGMAPIQYSKPTVSIGRIPALAQGAVIPPNREFLAVLGDQRTGTNIEAPLDTIKQAVSEVLSQRGIAGEEIVIPITLELDGAVLYRNQQRVALNQGYPVGMNPSFSY